MTAAPTIVDNGSPARRRWLALWLLLPVIFLPIALSWLGPVPSENWHYVFADAGIISSDTPVAGMQIDGPVKLPDAWTQTRRGFGGLIEYRIDLRALDASVAQSVFIPRATRACDVLLNGNLLHAEIGRDDAKGANRVVFVSLPGAIREGGNQLTIRLRGYPNSASGLSDVYVGPTTELYRAYFVRWLVQDELLRLANLTVIAMCLPFILLWLRDRKNAQAYGLFAAGAFIFAFRSFPRQVDAQFLSAAYLAPLVSASLGWSALAIWLFLVRYVNLSMPRFERSMVAFVIAGTIVLFFLPTGIFSLTDTLLWRIPILLSGIFCVVLFARETSRSPSRSRLLLTCGLFAQVAPALHDLLWLLGYVTFASAQWFPLSFPALFVVMGLILADDMASTRSALRNANTDLEEKITAARRELNLVYEEKRLQDAETFKLEERGRLMREMHDGVGTHLSLLLSGLHHGNLTEAQVRDSVQLSLDELRLLIDARSPSTETLLDAISNLRYRLEPRLQQVGASTSWTLDENFENVLLSTEATLHVLRIVQECVTNAIRHGRATQIGFRICAVNPSDGEPPGLRIEIADNGCGPENASPATRGSGTGLSNIRARAVAIGARFVLDRVDGMTVATIILPVGDGKEISVGTA